MSKERPYNRYELPQTSFDPKIDYIGKQDNHIDHIICELPTLYEIGERYIEKGRCSGKCRF